MDNIKGKTLEKAIFFCKSNLGRKSFLSSYLLFSIVSFMFYLIIFFYKNWLKKNLTKQLKYI